MVDKVEQLLMDMGFHQIRVCVYGKMARIEIEPEEFGMLIAYETRNRIIQAFKDYGFTYIAMDLTGYRTFSVNKTLSL